MTDDRPPIAYAWLAAALGLWALLTFGHGTGLDIVSKIVAWVRQPGTVVDEGGDAAFLAADHILTSVFAAGFLGLVGLFLWRFRRVARGRWADAALPWLLWALLTGLVWRFTITYSTELVHFAQYALVGALLYRADGGRRPQRILGIGFLLGFLDELWQHYGLHVWMEGELNHYLDFSDPILNLLGVCLGLLPSVTAMRLRGDTGDEGPRTARIVIGVAAVVLLPLLLIEPVSISKWLGNYPWYPFWDEHTNHKAVHWPTPAEGAPAILIALLLALPVVDPSRRGRALLRWIAVAGLVLAMVQPPTRRAGTPVHEDVPAVVAGWASTPITVDGRLDDPAWDQAPRIGPFVDNTRGTPTLATCGDAPLKPTFARVLWDSTALYLAFEADDDDLWAADLPRDHPSLPFTDGVRIMVDDGGDEMLYYEFGVSTRGEQGDQMRLLGFAPLDYNPWSQFIAMPRWEAPEVVAATHYAGTLDTTASFFSHIASPADTGYTVEIVIPWEVFRTDTTPTGQLERLSIPPRPGQFWRLGLYRYEYRRLSEPGIEAGNMAVGDALEFLGVDRAYIDQRVEWNALTFATGDSLVASGVWWEHLSRCLQLQAWSPTYLSTMDAERFGVLEFGPPPGSAP